MSIVIGCDPGLSGCFVAVNPETKSIISYLDIACIGEKIDVAGIVKWLKQFPVNSTRIICENPHTHKDDGIKTVFAGFRFGYSVGTIQAIPLCLGYSVQYSTPMTWKANFKLIDGTKTYQDKKELSVIRAIELNPSQQDIFMEIKQQGRTQRQIFKHDRAEAYLMAIYGIEKGEN